MTIAASVGKIVLRTVEHGIGSCENGVLIGTTTDVYGYGCANVAVAVSAVHFREIAEAMMAANADEAAKAFGHALKDGIAAQRPFKELHKTTDEELRSSLQHAFRTAKALQDAAERA